MADKKISQLPAATLPLAGTELLPIVQSGTTDNITVNNLAAGNIKSNATTGVLQVTGPAAASTRVMTTPDANFTVARTDAAQNFVGNNTFDTTTLCIDATNNRVGLGTATPSRKLDVVSANVVVSIDSTNSNNNKIELKNNGSLVGVIGASATQPVIIADSAYAPLVYVDTSGNITANTGNLVIGTNLKGISFEGGDGLISVNNAASNIYIGGGGTSPTGVYLQGTYAFVPGAYNDTTASAANLFVASNGELKRSTSALKYKQNVRDLEEIDTNLIRPVRYKSKCDNDDQTKDHFGVIADEVDAAGITELVIYGENGEVEGFDYGKLTVVLLKKIQSLEAKIKALEGK